MLPFLFPKKYLVFFREPFFRRAHINNKKRNANRHSFLLSLSLRELRCATSFLQAVLLSFLRTRVTRQEAFLLECGTAAFFCFEKRSCNAQTDCASLTGVTTAYNVYDYVVLSFYFKKRQGLLNDVLQRTLREIIFKSAVVDNDRAVTTGDKTNTCNRLLSSARTPELKLLFYDCFSHNSLTSP